MTASSNEADQLNELLQRLKKLNSSIGKSDADKKPAQEASSFSGWFTGSRNSEAQEAPRPLDGVVIEESRAEEQYQDKSYAEETFQEVQPTVSKRSVTMAAVQYQDNSDAEETFQEDQPMAPTRSITMAAVESPKESPAKSSRTFKRSSTTGSIKTTAEATEIPFRKGKRCHGCLNILMADAKFCRHCGRQVEDSKFQRSFDVSERGLEARTFSGEGNVETTFSDFDLVFVFQNPGHVEEYSNLVAKGTKGKEFMEGMKAENNTPRTQRASIRKFEDEESEDERKFRVKLIEREHMRHHGNGPRVMLRCVKCKKTADSHVKGDRFHCSSCDGRLEELMKQCAKCMKKVNYDDEVCRYCSCFDLRVKVYPMVDDQENLAEEPEVYAFYVEELLRDFFTDPRQGDLVEVEQDITSLQEARRAVLDIFLSFFRGQEKDEYYTYLFKSVDFDELFLCVKICDTTARTHALHEQFACALDMDMMQKPIEEGGMHVKYTSSQYTLLCCSNALAPLVNSFRSYFDNDYYQDPGMEGGLVQYEPGLQPLLKLQPEEADSNRSSVLSKSDRIRLLYDKVTDVLSVQDMIHWGMLIDFFPLHTKEALTKLKNSWGRVGLAYKYTQPMSAIKDYFGPNVALYFVFLEHFLKYSVILMVLGLVLTLVDLIVEIRRGNAYSHHIFLNYVGGKAGIPELRIAFALFLIVWCLVLKIKLSRKVATTMNLWGLDSEAHSTVKAELNPRFAQFATITESEVNEHDLEFNIPREMKARGRFLSTAVTICYVVLGISCSVYILRLQSVLSKAKNPWGHRMSLVLTIQIKIFNILWGTVGQWLVDHEYWKERLQYDNSMAYKNFYVQLVTTFIAFYWIAFAMMPLGDTSYQDYGEWKDHGGQEEYSPTPWEYLTYQMIYTFGLYLVFSVYDLISPLIMLWWSRRSERKALEEMGERNWQYSFIELQAKMLEYDGDLQNDDYMQILLPYGFVLFFGATLPIGAVFCWFYTSVQLRVDAWKLCHAMKRPYPRTTRPGAWVWEDIIEVFLQLAIVTNIALVSFVLQPIRKQPLSFRVATFFGLCLAANLFHWILGQLYPAESELVRIAKRRHEYQRETAQRLYSQEFKEDFLKLRANAQIRFDAAVGRLRTSGYKSSNHEVTIDRSLVDKIFQRELPLEFWKEIAVGDGELPDSSS